MAEVFPADLSDRLLRERREARRAAGRLRLRDGEVEVPVIRSWSGGLALSTEDCAGLRGKVALYDGEDCVGHGLIVAVGQEGDVTQFAFKRLAPPQDAPPRDYAPGDDDAMPGL
ncbi:hypothetical protein DXV76_04315 [Rhodobacteraceae bacterium CCMM004]|nr:hypothetical protein DXV76_04315 [Rhodobacteraceae bacterium CCMM004]